MNKEANIKCDGCGAALTFKSGTGSLSCQYCGHSQAINIETDSSVIEEFDINEYVRETFDKEAVTEVATVKCNACSAETTLGDRLASKVCPFCSAPLVIQQAQVKRMHTPQYMLPFAVTEKEAFSNFQSWIKRLWFAPNALKQYAVRNDKLQGVYLPFWTYDCSTTSRYVGKRGENYTVSGPNNSRTTRVRWSHASGTVYSYFDDVLVPATSSLPNNRLEALEPWDLENLKPYDGQFLTGFKTENYQITLRQGFSDAKNKMLRLIRQRIKADIGGDRQNISHIHTEYDNTTFKHILLPCWVSAYRFNGKTYQFLVNARTAEVQGDRPFSWVKITLAILTVLTLVGVLYSLDWKVIGEQLSLSINSL